MGGHGGWEREGGGRLNLVLLRLDTFMGGCKAAFASTMTHSRGEEFLA